MNIIIVLAMHGAPSIDFPGKKIHEFMGLHARLEHAHHGDSAQMEQRYNELDAEIRNWPRTPENDPFYAGALDMAAQLRSASGYEVIVGYNEFCAPRISEAIDQAVVQGAGKIIVVTPMMTRGGEHAEKDIRGVIEGSRKRHPEADILYAWPFETSEVADFLTTQIKKYV
jgi:sirohydrochlorin cobaltochelatase